ncbi:UNVERIFIED_CONTAM: Leucine-rich repeat-containing protein 3 [Gekko kuhli]
MARCATDRKKRGHQQQVLCAGCKSPLLLLPPPPWTAPHPCSLLREGCGREAALRLAAKETRDGQANGIPSTSVQCQCTNYSGEAAVLCSASNLEEIPKDIPKDTMFLKLDANKITAVPNSTFRHLAHLQEIDLSKNAIEKIDSAAFKGMADGLRLLDLSGNHIQRIPKEALVNLNAMIRLSNNPWHCECTLQEVLEEVKLDPESVNEITCQTSVQEEYAGKPLLHILDSGINFCNMHQKTTDVAMFVTMFSWFTLVISYVVYYVRHNQEDTKKHLEYLKSLPSTRVPKETISTIL